jgi:hypothetical protein
VGEGDQGRGAFRAAVRRIPNPQQTANPDAQRGGLANSEAGGGIELLTALAPGLQEQHFDQPIADAAKDALDRDVQSACATGVADAPHARAGEGLFVPGGVSDRRIRDAAERTEV